jgi:hypothetical protein
MSPATDGRCDSPTTLKKRITIKKTLVGERRLEVLIHEMLHACYWDLDEEAIDITARDIARVLFRLGYRSPNDSK